MIESSDLSVAKYCRETQIREQIQRESNQFRESNQSKSLILIYERHENLVECAPVDLQEMRKLVLLATSTEEVESI